MTISYRAVKKIEVGTSWYYSLHLSGYYIRLQLSLQNSLTIDSGLLKIFIHLDKVITDQTAVTIAQYLLCQKHGRKGEEIKCQSVKEILQQQHKSSYDEISFFYQHSIILEPWLVIQHTHTVVRGTQPRRFCCTVPTPYV